MLPDTAKVYTDYGVSTSGIIGVTKQITDGVTYGDDTKPMTYAYNLGGALVEQAYPSGRVVKNTFDENGDLAQIQSKKNSGSGFFTYSDEKNSEKNRVRPAILAILKLT